VSEDRILQEPDYGFEFKEQLEKDGGAFQERTDVYEHENGAEIHVAFVEAKYSHYGVRLVDGMTVKEERFGFEPSVYVRDVARYYDKYGIFGEEGAEEKSLKVDEILDHHELPPTPDELRFEEFADSINVFLDDVDVEFKGTDGELLKTFFNRAHGQLWVYGNEVRRANRDNLVAVLHRLVHCYEYKPEMFFDDSWIDYARGHIR
jgi:hypothetical protein